MSEQVILHGAGSAGRETLQSMRDQGIYPVCFADNDKRKQSLLIQGLKVMEPKEAQLAYPLATWVVSIYKAEARDVRNQLRGMGVKVKPLGTHLPFCQPIPESAARSVWDLCPDVASGATFVDQVTFRKTLDYEKQMRPDPMSELYFPPFIKKVENEVFVDCGAADGDTVEAFIRWQPHYMAILAYEPDTRNYLKCKQKCADIRGVTVLRAAANDHDGVVTFAGDLGYASHIAKMGEWKVDGFKLEALSRATFVKMDIEGSELRAIWGARKLLKERKPVLAICAYHEPDHLWEIPLLVHAIQPDYELRLRRYAEGTRELVWYCVPKERLCTT